MPIPRSKFVLFGAYCASWLAGYAHAVRYSEYILAPNQRTLDPVSVYRANGTVYNPEAVTSTGVGSVTFSGLSAVTYDYSKNIGGLVSFVVDSVSGAGQYIGISYTESSLWISPDGSDATQNIGIDETLWFAIDGPGNFSVDSRHQRGGFKYLNVYHKGSGNMSLSAISTYFTAMPHYPDDAIGNYTGFFHSNDEKLNRVWYAGMVDFFFFFEFRFPADHVE